MRRSGLLGEHPYDAYWDRNNFTPPRPLSQNYSSYAQNHPNDIYGPRPALHPPDYPRFPANAVPSRPYRNHAPWPPGSLEPSLPIPRPTIFQYSPNNFPRPPLPPPGYNTMFAPTFPEPFARTQNASCQADTHTDSNLVTPQYLNSFLPEVSYDEIDMAVDEYPAEPYPEHHHPNTDCPSHDMSYNQLSQNSHQQCEAPQNTFPLQHFSYSNHDPFYPESSLHAANRNPPSNLSFLSQPSFTAPVDRHSRFLKPSPQQSNLHANALSSALNLNIPNQSNFYSNFSFLPPENHAQIINHEPSSSHYDDGPMQSSQGFDRDIFRTPSPNKPTRENSWPDNNFASYGARNPSTVQASSSVSRAYCSNEFRTNRSTTSSSSKYNKSFSPERQQSSVSSTQSRQPYPSHPPKYTKSGTMSSHPRQNTPIRTCSFQSQPPRPAPSGASIALFAPPSISLPFSDSSVAPKSLGDSLMIEDPTPPERPSVSPAVSSQETAGAVNEASTSDTLIQQQRDSPSPVTEDTFHFFPLNCASSTVYSVEYVSVQSNLDDILKAASVPVPDSSVSTTLLPTSPVHSDISERLSISSSARPEATNASLQTEGQSEYPPSTSRPYSPTTASDSGLGSTNASVVDEALERSGKMAPAVPVAPPPDYHPRKPVDSVELVSNSKSNTSKTPSSSKNLPAVRPPSFSKKVTEYAGSSSKVKITANNSSVEADYQKSVLLEQQNIVHSVFRQHERLQNTQAILQPSPSSSRPSRERSVEQDNTSSTVSASSTRAKPRTRLSSEEGSLHSREGPLSTSIITTLEVTPKKLLNQDLQDLTLMIKKLRKSEALLPDYQNKEPRRMLGIFPQRLLLEFKKLMEGLNKVEKKKTVECIGRIGVAEVVNILKNVRSERDTEMLQNIAVFAAKRHSKQENFTVYFCLLIANGFDLNVKDEDGQSILAIVMRSGDIALLDLLLPHAAHLSLDAQGHSALHIAYQLWKADPKANWDVVTLVLDNSPASLMFAKNNVYRTAISFFCGEHQLFQKDELEAFILQYRTKEIEEEAESLLHCLAAARRVELISFCLGFYPFDPNRLDADNRTFTHRLAELSGLTRHEAELMMDMVRICGAKTDIADRKGLTAIDVAARCGNQELVRLWTKYSKVPSTFEPGSFVGDISFGREAKPIKVINEKTLVTLNDFVYIRENIYLGEAPSLKGMMYCGCRAGQCSTTTCLCLKRGLAYSRSGTIVPGTCKGNPIFECGPHCACGPDCSSRVVQKGIRMPFEIFMTTKRGWGVRATRTIQPGEFIMEFVGEIIESDRLLARDPHNDWAMELTIDNYDGTMYHVDPTRCGNVARFLNHSCDPNLFPVRVYVSGDALDTGVRMAMFSAQVVQKSHELTFHYGDLYWQRQVDKGVFCACGSSKCKFQAKKRKAR